MNGPRSERTGILCTRAIGGRWRVLLAAAVLGLPLAFIPTGAASASRTTISDVQVNAPFDGPFIKNANLEPAIAQNPTDPLNIVVASIEPIQLPACTDTYPSSCAPPSPPAGTSIAGFYASFDGGKTFPCQGQVDLSGFGQFGSADPWLAFDSRGKAYYGMLSNPGSFSTSDFFVAKSADGGCTWLTAAKVSGTAQAILDDKDSIAADANLTSPFRDSVYATWVKLSPGCCGGVQVVFSRSTDGGTTWSNPKGISPSNCCQADREAPVVQVGPTGTVYVVWLDSVQKTPELRMSISYDGGKTFPKQNLTVAAVGSETIFDEPIPGATFPTHTSWPSLSVGPDGSLYVAWGRRTIGHTVVMLSRSTTGGLTWTSPMVAADVGGRSDVQQSVAVNPFGAVSVAFVAADDVPEGTPPGAGVVHYDAYWAQSTDGGTTFSLPVKISSASSDPDASFYPSFPYPTPQFIGDYMSVVADSSHVYAVWTDTRNGATCQAVDDFTLGMGPAPNIIAQCPLTFGNADIYLGTVSL